MEDRWVVCVEENPFDPDLGVVGGVYKVVEGDTERGYHLEIDGEIRWCASWRFEPYQTPLTLEDLM